MIGFFILFSVYLSVKIFRFIFFWAGKVGYYKPIGVINGKQESIFL